MQSPTNALVDLLDFIEHDQVNDLPSGRSLEFADYLERANQALQAVPQASPFARHREVFLGYYSTAAWLRQLVMHLWNSHDYPVQMNTIASFDARHRQIALEMIEHYARHGEGDPDFMQLASEVRERLASEAAITDE